MTKQEEIKLILYAVKIGQMTEDVALKAFDKLGVVIKVERKLPLISEADVKEWNEATIDGIKTCQRFMLKAGYVATKPLIDAVSSPIS